MLGRATAQWFCNLGSLAPRATKELEQVKIVPPAGACCSIVKGRRFSAALSP